MAKSKAGRKTKKRGGLIGAIATSINGWKKIGGYVASGKWAEELSAIAHGGGGASGRARRKAMERERERQERVERMMEEQEEREWQEEQDRKFKEDKERLDREQQRHKDGLQRIRKGHSYEPPLSIPAKRNSAAAKVKAAAAKVPTEIQVQAHNRSNTKNGVKESTRKINKKQADSFTALELLKPRKQP